jgi:hypothetical protein
MQELYPEYVEIDLFDLIKRTQHKNKIELIDLLDVQYIYKI